MIELSLLIVSICASTMMLCASYVLLKMPHIIKECLRLYGIKSPHKNEKSILVSSTTTLSTDEKPKRQYSVSDLPPEILAPALKNPPKPAGGFGRKIEE